MKYPIISLDTEYSEKNVRKAELLSISIGVSPKEAIILQNPEQFNQAKEFIDGATTIFTWNGVVDWYILQRNGFSIGRGQIIDAMLLEHLIDERMDHGLGDYVLREVNDDYKAQFWGKYERYQDAPKDEAYDYEYKDATYTFQAGQKYLEILRDKQELIRHVHALQWALFDTEIRGLKVNLDLMLKTREEMSAKINEYLPRLRQEFDEHCKNWEMQKWAEEIGKRKTDKGRSGVPKPVFSFSSDRQVSWLLYDSLELEAINKTKKGKPSTDYETLKTLGERHPQLKTLIDYKETKSVFATFIEGMIDRVEDGRIYPSFFINGTATGRISHANPNMGNLPTTGVIRNFFIPDEGMSLVGADFSQLEVVVEANLTEDIQLLKIINEGASKHDITAQGLSISRDDAKTLNFALQYGAGVHKVGKILNISYQEAQDIYNRYWKLYSGVKSLKDKTCKDLAETGQVTNLFGRTRHFDKPRNEFEKAKQERQAYNHLIQGVGADMTNMASYKVANYFIAEGLGQFLFSVHDEILSQVHEKHAESAKSIIVDIMCSVNDYLNFKYRVQAKAYGPLTKWEKT